MSARQIGDILRPIIADIARRVAERDDSQVTDLIVRKRYSERPRLVITMEIEEL